MATLRLLRETNLENGTRANADALFGPIPGFDVTDAGKS